MRIVFRCVTGEAEACCWRDRRGTACRTPLASNSYIVRRSQIVNRVDCTQDAQRPVPGRLTGATRAWH